MLFYCLFFQLLVSVPPSLLRPYAQVLNNHFLFSFTAAFEIAFRKEILKRRVGERAFILSLIQEPFFDFSLFSVATHTPANPLSGQNFRLTSWFSCPQSFDPKFGNRMPQEASRIFAFKPKNYQPCVCLQTSKSKIRQQRRKALTIQTAPAGANHLHHSSYR